MLSSIVRNAEIDVIWDKWQQTLEPLRGQINKALCKQWQEWEILRDADAKWPDAAKKLHTDWWQARIARQKEIDASIAAKAEFEYLYDKPYEDKKKVRIAGPFTVESLSPHRVLGVDENDELIDAIGEPDIDILEADAGQVRVKVNGVDVFHPNTGEVRSDGADGIACWFIDTDYNEESFFVRHAYFLGANDPYKALKTTLKAEINQEAWASLNSDTSRPFDKPKSGRIAVKVINHLGDEVMKVFRCG